VLRGLRADGVTMAAPAIHGTCVKIADSPDNTIGGTTAAARNVLSGCGFGVHITGTKSTGNVVQGNYIGPNAAGTGAVRNSNGSQSIGVNIGNASNNVIGGDTAPARNVISGNSVNGVRVAGTAAANAVKGNYIGTDAAGTAALPNRTGVEILSANNVVGGLALAPGVAPGNLIAGQPTNLHVNGSGALVQGNLIGLDATGSYGFAGGNFGIVCFAANMVIGGTQTSARNVISGVNTGVYIDGFGAAVIQGNFIGTDLWGLNARGNVSGINVAGRGSQIGGTAAGAGNVISGNRQGVWLRGGASTVQGNLIGTDASMTAAQFVDKLNANAGTVLTQAERDELFLTTRRTRTSAAGSSGSTSSTSSAAITSAPRWSRPSSTLPSTAAASATEAAREVT